MPRGPFQGNFVPNVRPTVVTAPDAIVYINGEQDIIGCPNCKRRFDFGKYITSIQTNLDVDSAPGSASITMSVPRHTIDDFYFDGVPVISPMMEVEIFGKGYYLLEGVPQYYPMFWGLITEVSVGYSNGEHTVTVQCADILKWWEICRMNINPAFTAPTGQMGRSIFGNVLYGTNPYDMIFTLANMAFGDVILGTGSLVSLYKEAGQKATFNAALGDIMQYWSSRFSRIRSNLLLYGVSGIAVRGDSIAHAYESGKFKPERGRSYICNAIRNANGGSKAAQLAFDPTDPDVTAFRTQFSQAGEVNFWQHEYQTKLEIANLCKEAVGFEFYMDVTGDIVFKPPFFNLDILSNKPISWLQDIDIIDINFSDSEAEVVTQLTIQGSYGGSIEYGFGPEITPFTSVTDYHLLRKYGWRPHTYNSEFMGDLTRMFYHGLDILDRINSKRHQATANIPMRPELRLGFPIYIPFLDQVWYVKGISNNIQFGGRATTSLTLTARRGKFLAPRGISTLKTLGSYDNVHNLVAAVSKPGVVQGLAAVAETSKNFNSEKLLNPKGFQNTGKVEGPPSVRQLAQRAFVLDLGDAATLPPINVDPKDPNTLRPYEPLVLRHPKTGKIVGYPNVVMVYTRPYDPSQAFDNLAGQKKPGTNKNVSPKNKEKVGDRQKSAGDLERKVYSFDQTVQLENKYAHNRYSYGLNSAGVYVYAYDVDKSVTQFSLIPSKNIYVTGDGVKITDDGIKLENPNSMVRPVSDERGFEVIGHFRYGRGVSLRDGSLIYNEGSTNTIADVGTQLALGGDLLATLTAQSQGLTSVITAYPNPADAVARLQPEDLETAAVLLPGDEGKKVPQFSNTGTNFVDTAPLGSPESDGVPTSLEASQLSRALSLAEMTVRETLVPGDPKCDCQAGRAELAFINVGYQLQPLNPAAPTEGSTLYNKSTAGTSAAPGSFGYFSAATGGLQQPFASDLKATDVITRVEQYLSNLYEALDAPHQQLENALRGNPSGLESDLRKTPDLFTGGEGDPTFGNVTPPFSSPNRAALGDPVATAQQVVSSSSDLKRTFNEFGSNLKKTQQKAQLQQQVSQLRAKDERLKGRLTQVEAELADKHSIAIGTTDTPESLNQQIAQTEQEIANKETELAQLG